MSQEGRLQNYSVDQVAGAFVLVMGAIGSLLLVVWQSKCHCKMNLCYIFQCERRPPSEEEMKSLKGQVKDKKDEKEQKKQDKIDQDLEKQEKQLAAKKSPTTMLTSSTHESLAQSREVMNLDD
tara:strand:+ start:422 stop:790 length:369 start_codon:yes stop_codon:yes gene_type:complete